MARGKLFVLSGPSGTGKGSICRQLLGRNDSIRLSISMTTREPRTGEEHGVHYFFAEVEEFRRLIEADGFIEYADVYGNYYGTPKAQVEQWLAQGDDVLLEIDVQGALQVKENFPQSILIFVLPPSIQVLRDRLVGRGTDAADVIERRMANAVHEIELLDRYDYMVVNDILEVAVTEVESVIRSEHCKVESEIADEVIGRYKEDR